jgi:hypothetical protein
MTMMMMMMMMMTTATATFLFVVHLTRLTLTQSMGRAVVWTAVNNKLKRICKERSGRKLIYTTIPVFAWRYWGNPRNNYV